MNRRIAALSLLALSAALSPLVASAQTPVAGSYQGEVNGVTTTLTLQGSANRISGAIVEGALQLGVRGSQQGNRLSLQLLEPGQGQEVARLEGQVDGSGINGTLSTVNPQTGQVVSSSARFVRAGTAAPVAPTSAAGGQVDPRLVGRWVNEKQINSGGANFASFSTVRTLEFDGSGRIMQTVQSAGGGGNWSYNGGGRKVEFSGRWYAKDGVVYVQADGTSGFTAASRYRFAEPYLITESRDGRINWRR